jgi:hypothetical protein
MRLRVSLVNIVGVLIIAGLSFGWWRSIRQHQELMAHNQGVLKDWVEPLAVKDPTQWSFRRLPPRNVGFNQWRIYLPPGRQYELRCVIADPLMTSVAERFTLLESMPMTSGQSLVEVDWREDVEGKPQMFLAILPPNSPRTIGAKIGFPPLYMERFAQSQRVGETYLGDESKKKPSLRGQLVLANIHRNFVTGGGQSSTARGGVLVFVQAVGDPSEGS